MDLLAALERVFRRQAQLRLDRPRSGDIAHSVAAMEKARKLLSYASHVSFEDGLRETVASVIKAEKAGLDAAVLNQASQHWNAERIIAIP